MCGRNAPPVVGKAVENAEHNNEEGGGPFGFETDCNHDASTQTKDRHEETGYCPFSLDDETEEEEDEKHATGQEEAWNGR